MSDYTQQQIASYEAGLYERGITDTAVETMKRDYPRLYQIGLDAWLTEHSAV